MAFDLINLFFSLRKNCDKYQLKEKSVCSIDENGWGKKATLFINRTECNKASQS